MLTRINHPCVTQRGWHLACSWTLLTTTGRAIVLLVTYTYTLGLPVNDRPCPCVLQHALLSQPDMDENAHGVRK